MMRLTKNIWRISTDCLTIKIKSCIDEEMIARETKPAHQKILISLLLTTSEKSTQQGFIAELYLFFIRYTFLLEQSSNTKNSCASKTPQLNVPQGNIYMGARYLDPKYSRWLSTDPALTSYVERNYEGPSSGIYNSVNLNLYHYGGNNPIKYVDPDGREEIPHEVQKIMEEKAPVAGKVDGKQKYGTVSNDLIELLKRIETPTPDEDGKIGLHLPGDGTLTYGYGEVVGDAQEITDDLKAKFPQMTEEEATRRLKEDVLPDYETYVSNKLYNRNMSATQQEFDAYVLDDFNNDSGPLMDKIKNSPYKSKSAITKIFKDYNITYSGLTKRREAEAKVYTEGDYSEDFSW